MTYVYFAEDNRPKRRGYTLVKIGRSDTPDVRLRALQTANGHRLRLLGWIPATDRTEADLHAAFANFLVRGEWYRVYPAGRELICAVCDEAERRALVRNLEASLSNLLDRREE